MATINPLRRLLDLLPADPLQIGTISGTHTDGTATVALAGGTGTLRVRNPGGVAGGSVYVQGGQITGAAPSLPVLSIEIP
jgi:outer membrane lipoprotein SlyB